MTLILVSKRTPEATKESLFQGKTVVWFNDLIIGKEEFLEQIIKDNIHFGPLKYIDSKTILNIDVKNDTFLPTQLSSAEYEAMFHMRSRRV